MFAVHSIQIQKRCHLFVLPSSLTRQGVVDGQFLALVIKNRTDKSKLPAVLGASACARKQPVCTTCPGLFLETKVPINELLL